MGLAVIQLYVFVVGDYICCLWAIYYMGLPRGLVSCIPRCLTRARTPDPYMRHAGERRAPKRTSHTKHTITRGHNHYRAAPTKTNTQHNALPGSSAQHRAARPNAKQHRPEKRRNRAPPNTPRTKQQDYVILCVFLCCFCFSMF
jgi:hypothetical protein